MIAEARVVSGQLRLGDAEITTFKINDILARIAAAHSLAGMRRLLFLPSHSPKINDAVFAFCREQGIEMYLWYKVLADNDIIAETNELLLNAWGGRGSGVSGLWTPIFDSEESYLFGCPRNEKYINLLLNHCGQRLPRYDGLFLDYFGFPLPSLGLESLFTCFCPYCEAAEPRLGEWRRRVHALREAVESASDDDLEKWGTFSGVIEAFGLTDFFRFRMDSVTEVAAKFSELARRLGKGLGVDVLSPSLSALGGHHFPALGKLADWLKPRLYLRTYGPSSIPLEYYSMALGMRDWGRRFSLPALLEFIGRSSNVAVPQNVHHLRDDFLSPAEAAAELAAFRTATPSLAHIGIECSDHPEYKTLLDCDAVGEYLEATNDADGLVLSWNILFVPDEYLRLVGKRYMGLPD